MLGLAAAICGLVVAGAGTLDDVLWATAYQTALMLKVRVVLLLPEGESIAVRAGYPPEDLLDEADLAAAKAWHANDPYVKAGLFAHSDLRPWKVTFNPIGANF